MKSLTLMCLFIHSHKHTLHQVQQPLQVCDLPTLLQKPQPFTVCHLTHCPVIFFLALQAGKGSIVGAVMQKWRRSTAQYKNILLRVIWLNGPVNWFSFTFIHFLMILYKQKWQTLYKQTGSNANYFLRANSIINISDIIASISITLP
jgi:hypothetical protein